MVADLTQNIDHKQRRLMVLNMAHEILHNRYVERKTVLHNEWALAAAAQWRTQGTKLAYPVLPPYPDAPVVVQAAQVLWQFLHAEEGDLPTSHELDEESQLPMEPYPQEFEQLWDDTTFPEQSLTQTEVDSTSRDPDHAVEQDTHTLGRRLPSWLLRSKS
jgi:hypothetical protein